MCWKWNWKHLNEDLLNRKRTFSEMHFGTDRLLQFYIVIVFNTVINKCDFIGVRDKEIPLSWVYKILGKSTLTKCILRARDFKEIDKPWAFKTQTNSKSVGYCYIIDPNIFDEDNNADVIKMVVDSKVEFIIQLKWIIKIKFQEKWTRYLELLSKNMPQILLNFFNRNFLAHK